MTLTNGPNAVTGTQQLGREIAARTLWRRCWRRWRRNTSSSWICSSLTSWEP